MIWTIVMITMFIIGVLGLVGAANNLWFFKKLSWSQQDPIELISVLCALVGGLATMIMITVIITTHCVGVDLRIQRIHIKQEALEQRIEIANSEYEDVSKSQVIADVAEWNEKVIEERYWSTNPWTSWFYNSKEVAEKHLIEY